MNRTFRYLGSIYSTTFPIFAIINEHLIPLFQFLGLVVSVAVGMIMIRHYTASIKLKQEQLKALKEQEARDQRDEVRRSGKPEPIRPKRVEYNDDEDDK